LPRGTRAEISKKLANDFVTANNAVMHRNTAHAA
jgi:hypothetical protein